MGAATATPTQEDTMPRDGYCPECNEYIGEDAWTECPNCGALFAHADDEEGDDFDDE
jgi:Zn finger protein HypA/HybF involved in hydrogenase expression